MNTALALALRLAGMFGKRSAIGRSSVGLDSRQKGFTMVEVLIAMFIASIVAAALYTAYNTFFRQANVQDMLIESQQNARVAINLMEKELLNAGYNAGTPDIITTATANTITFRYVDPDPNTATPGKFDVTYATAAVGGITYLTRQANNVSTGAIGNTEKVVPYVNALAFQYFDSTGAALTPPFADQTARNGIKFITVQLATQTKSGVQQFSGTGAITGTAAKVFSVETHVRLRNIGTGTTVLDTTPPAPPTGLKVRDPGLCNRLTVQWNNNTEGDLAGYKVYYGTASGSYIGNITIPLTTLVDPSATPQYSCTKNSTVVNCTISPTTPALAYTPSTTAAGSGIKYYIAVKAYDNALNLSGFGTAAVNPALTEVSGDPATSNSNVASGVDDSTINPTKPTPVTGFIGANGGEKQVRLTWSAYDTVSRPDVTGFRIYRSTTPFTTYPIDPATSSWIAAEPGKGKPALGPTATSFTDTGSDLSSGLMGCYVYYYAIAPANCDATLITDDGGDPASKKYVQTDYAATCGNGTAACSAGTGFASVAGSDTAPPKTTAPSSPALNARAGWQRVAITLTQPPVVPPRAAGDDPDIDRTCVYGVAGSAYPMLSSGKDAMNCFSPTGGAVRIPENTGVFPVSATNAPYSGQSLLARSTTTTFWNNSLTTLTSSPSLTNLVTYSYAAVAFDLCGNASNPADAQATTTLCGEDPVGKPPAVGDFGTASASCCSTPVSLTWTAVPSNVSSPSSATNPWDLAGYRIFRSTSSTDWTAATLLNPAAPLWGTTYDDSTAVEGGTYYYRIVSTDCPYENGNDAGHTPITSAQIRADMISGYLKYTQVGPVTPGRIVRDEKCQGAGACVSDPYLHREVLTGVDTNNTAGNGNNASTPISTYVHDRVTMFMENTSASTMTIQKVTVAWVNPSAVLAGVTIGGGRSGFSALSTPSTGNLTPGLSTSYTGNSPYTARVLNLVLTPATISAKTTTLYNVPITFRFTQYNSGTGTYVPVDMRDDQLLISLYVRNDSTGTVDCVTYLTTSGGSEGIYVPYGPSVTAVSQDKPSSPTFAYAVPGVTGLNTVPSGSDGQVKVNATNTVTVTADISGQTADEASGGTIAVTSATLYWKDTDKDVTIAPSSGYTAITMTNTAGTTWVTSTAIPAQNGKRVWYYIMVTDADGNWDRDPELSDGAYVYDQKNVNVCDLTPSQPTGLTVVPSGSAPYTATLNWNPVTTYTGGGSIIGTDTIKYRVYKNGSATPLISDLTATTYTDPTPLAGGLSAGVYSYTVKATNSCASPGPNVSVDSATAAACIGASGQATINVSPTTLFRGASYTVTINDCFAINGGYSATTEVINSTAGFTGFNNTSGGDGAGIQPTITESGPATGLFTKVITTASGSSNAASGILHTNESDTVCVSYPYANGGACTNVSVVVDPCTKTPSAPTGVTGGSLASNKKSFTLSWTPPTTNTDSTAVAGLSGYDIWEKVCASTSSCSGSNLKKDWFLRTSQTPGSATSIVITADQSTDFTSRAYYFRVRAKNSCSNISADSNTWNETW